ncbi:hypothetical protein PR003_g28398 [Phytophthora rubi]|uniref:Uncharacterized protein n=1 Tax=Phytophthora rubi TaxID=129364 RepID=A0A6A3HIL2_9STRA|nr:hypothetical protein PR002_g27387 [Phytophthora rubi]KAE8970066.1 hypothetical protein PR001_g27317 [Phytophthora rubi]KAE9278850.1 hypothetical protein PR003_g28398 [Phytophthora rubi]
MADHLRSQEYLRLRRSANSLLLEPRMSDEDAARLVEAYERNDTSDSEYLQEKEWRVAHQKMEKAEIDNERGDTENK